MVSKLTVQLVTWSTYTRACIRTLFKQLRHVFSTEEGKFNFLEMMEMLVTDIVSCRFIEV